MKQDKSLNKQQIIIDSERVAEFLQINPEFFETNPEIVKDLAIPHFNDQGTTSLIEYQVKLLRAENEALLYKLKTLTNLANENENRWLKLKSMAMMLLTNRQDSKLKAKTLEWIKSEYNLLHVAVIEKSLESMKSKFELDEKIYQSLAKNEIYCGDSISAKAKLKLFKKHAQDIKSFALVPVMQNKSEYSALLILAANDTQRFTAQQQTTYLESISEILGAALLNN